MTLDQGFAFAIIVGMMGLFVWGRLRYDVVAIIALLASVATGIVPAEHAFAGFGDEILVIVASALLVSAAVARSGVVEMVLRRIGPYLTSVPVTILVLVGSVTIMAAFVKNIGALAMLIPVALQIARRNGIPPSYLLMPMSFGSLLGGVMTLIGTSPNIVVSRMRADIVGEPFRMFDFLPVGAGISIVGVLFLVFGYRLLPADRKGAASLDAAFNLSGYTTEARVPEDSPIVGKTVADLEALGEGEVSVSTIIRERYRRYTPSGNWTIYADDLLLLEGEPEALQEVVQASKLKLIGGAEQETDDEEDEKAANAETSGVTEAVVTGDSPLVDRTAAQMRLTERYQVRLIAVSRSGERISHRLRAVKFLPGDVIILKGNTDRMPEVLGDLRLLPLADRALGLGIGRRSFLPIAVLAVAMLAVAFQLVPVAIAFLSAALVLILAGSLSLKEAYEVVEWPILVLFGALIPVSGAMQTTGATEIIAGWLSALVTGLPALGALASIVIAAMAVTPFLNNAATVLVMAPIAAQLAARLGYDPDPFLIAVALGAACDFLTPIGHQSNTLVMGPGGYRFGDYWRLGLPLSFLVVLVGTPLIALVWPFSSG